MQISCKCKFNCDGKKSNSNPSGIRINVRLSAKIQKKIPCVQKNIWNPATCNKNCSKKKIL